MKPLAAALDIVLHTATLAAACVLAACTGGSSGFLPDAGSRGGAAGNPPTSCTSNADCSSGKVCDRASGSCVAAPTVCTSNSDCANAAGGKTTCDLTSGACVECNVASDCTGSAQCTNHSCVAVPTCKNSLDCPTGQVCDTTTSHCVACVQSGDCKTGEVCAANVCRATCTSDKTCTPLGQLCDTTSGHCADCLSDSDCSADQFCNEGTCSPDVCVGGTSSCDGNAVVACSANGSGTLPSVACTESQTCVAQGATAACRNWICSPSVKSCDTATERVLQCSADGQSQQPLQDCSANGQVCVAAACVPVVCVAGSTYCASGEVRQCSAKGDRYSVVQTCTATQYCDAPSKTCKNQVCAPGLAACNGTIATTCNADGSGYVSGGTDCAPSLNCIQGSCQSLLCAPGNRFCSGNTVMQCSADGLSSSVSSTCTSTQYCNPNTAACTAQVCTPNQPACDGSVATTCNAAGSGYTGARNDCALTTSPYCSSGQCVTGAACGTTVCPGSSCTTSGTTCYYLATTNATARTTATTLCSALGSGWSLCTSTQICNTTVFDYLAAQGCVCSSDTTKCGAAALSNVYLMASDYTSYALWTRNLPAPACSGGTPSCAESTSGVTTGAVLCCH